MTTERGPEAVPPESDERLLEAQGERLLAQLPVGVFRVGRDGRYTYVSDRWCEITGVSRDRVLGEPWGEAVHPADRKSVTAAVQRGLAGGEPLHVEYRCPAVNGATVWVLCQAQPDRDAEGRLVGGVGAITVITERKQVEEQLRSSEERFRRLTERVQDLLWRATAHGVLDYVSPAAERLYGVPADQLVGSRFGGMMSDESREQAERLFAATESGELDEARFVFEGKSAGGETRYFEVNAVAVRDAAGVLQCVEGVTRDITERARTELALRESEAKWRTMTEASPDYIFLLDHHGVIRWINRAVSTPRDQLLGAPLRGYLASECAADLEACLARVRASGKPDRCTLVHAAPTGSRRYFDARVGLMRFGQSEDEPQFVINATDISDRRNEQATQARLAAAIEQAAEIVVTTDVAGDVTYVNPAFTTATGYAAEEIVGENLSLLKGGQQDDGFYRELWSTVRSGKRWSGRFTNANKDGARYVEDAVISPVFDDGGHVVSFVKVARDVTEELEREVKVRHMQKMEALGTLTSGIAHDFNNLLSPIVGYTELALQDLPRDSATREDMLEVRIAARRATELVRQILALTRKSDVERRPLRISPLLDEVVKLLRAGLPATIEIRVRPSSSRAVVMADPTQVHQIAMNLCTNAAQAMPDGGVLELWLDETLLFNLVGPHGDLREGWYLRLFVRDTGNGMVPELAERIFDPYFTTKGAGEGTGLGLAIVLAAVKELGGGITVESAVGEGTTFCVHFPIHETARVVVEELDEAPPHGTESILLVDDEESVRVVTTKALAAMGYDVTAVASGAQVVATILAAPKRYALLLSDLTMPHMNGLQLAREVRAMGVDVPILLWSGYSEELPPEALADLGIAELLTKPLSVGRLGRTVRAMIDKPVVAKSRAGQEASRRS